MLLRTINKICFLHIKMNSLNSVDFVNRMSILNVLPNLFTSQPYHVQTIVFRMSSDTALLNIS